MLQMQKDRVTDRFAIEALMAHNKILENQIAQMATSSGSRQQGQLPPQGVQPKDTANAITLRSGTDNSGPSMPAGMLKKR